jgi:hypothetical protein
VVTAVARSSGRLARFAASVKASAAAAAGRVLTPHRASLRRLADIPLTVAGLGCIDAAAFTGNEIAGLVVTGFSLILTEHLIADDDDTRGGFGSRRCASCATRAAHHPCRSHRTATGAA